MEYSKDYNFLPDEDLEERDAIGMLAEENAVEGAIEQQRELDDKIDDAFEERELKRLMVKYADKIVGILKELNTKHAETAQSIQELETLGKPKFTITKIGG